MIPLGKGGWIAGDGFFDAAAIAKVQRVADRQILRRETNNMKLTAGQRRHRHSIQITADAHVNLVAVLGGEGVRGGLQIKPFAGDIGAKME